MRTVFRCGTCGASAPKWAGKCASCGEWNSLAEEFDAPADVRRDGPKVVPSDPARPIDTIDMTDAAAGPTGLAEVDRVLGGGLVPGSVTLLGGEPGIGKSTLLLQLLASFAAQGHRGLLVSGEESRQQVRLRAERLGALHPDVWMAAETMLPVVIGHIDEVKPHVVVIDSIQTMVDPELSSAPGSVGQVRECTHALVRLAKERDITVILVGHVTKDGTLAGPRVLEHVVDTVLSFEGDRHHALRLLRAVKHRFGATGELGVFEMLEAGLCGVKDPSAIFLGDRRIGAPGSVVVPAVEGQRPILVEVQGLVTGDGKAPMPRRAVQGLDQSRVALLVAVLHERTPAKVAVYDVFASSVGGVKVTEPAGDLATALALASSWSKIAVPGQLVAIGEVGLSGEVRQVGHMGRRYSEAARVGFTTALVAPSAPDAPKGSGISLLRVSTLAEAMARLGLMKRDRSEPT